jgi:hypothetical protein
LITATSGVATFLDKPPKSSLNPILGQLRFVWVEKCSIFVSFKVIAMKKALALVVLVALVSSCSSYTCPTYSKKEVKKEVKESRI